MWKLNKDWDNLGFAKQLLCIQSSFNKWYLQFHGRYSKLIHEWTFKRKKQYVFTLQILNNIFSWFMNKLWVLKINIQFKNQGAVKQKKTLSHLGLLRLNILEWSHFWSPEKQIQKKVDFWKFRYRVTAKRKLERLQFSISSSFFKIWSACSCEFKVYFWTFWALYHLLFYL